MIHISAAITNYLNSIGIPAIDRLATMPYDEYLKTDHWFRVRANALRRADYHCQRCPSKKILQVHHLTYERRGHELPGDLIVLCKKCHERAHKDKLRA